MQKGLVQMYRCMNLYSKLHKLIHRRRTNKSEQNKKSDIVYIIFKYLYKIIEAKSKIKRPDHEPYNMMC